jgi:hypothetical protein
MGRLDGKVAIVTGTHPAMFNRHCFPTNTIIKGEVQASARAFPKPSQQKEPKC